MSLTFSKSNIVWLIFFILFIPFISASVSVENVSLNASDNPYNTTKADLTGYVQNVTENTSLVYDWKENGTSKAKLNMPFNKKLSTTNSNAVRDYSSFEYNGTLGGGNSAKVPTWYDGLPTFSTDFNEYNAGQFPQNWTGRDAYHLNTKIINDSSYQGGKAYEVESTSSGHRVVSWDDPGNLSAVRISSQAKLGSGAVPYYVAGRGIANDSYYRLQVRNGNLLEIVVMDNGLTWPPIAAASFNYNTGDRVNLLFEVKNQSLRGKAWHQGTDEPDNWMVSTTNESINSSGWTGVGRLHTGTTYVDTFKVQNISDEDRTCVKGGCYEFDGQDDWIDIGDSVINPWEGFSISAWYKFDTLPSASDDHIIIGKGGHEQLLYGDNDDKIKIFTKNMNPDRYTINPVTVGKWEHVVVSYNQSGSLDAYINGTQTVDKEDVLIDNNTVDLSVSTTINGKQPDGSIDEVKIYNHSISGDHAKYLYEEGRKALKNDAKNRTSLSNEETNPGSNYSVDVTPTSKETIGDTTKSNTVSIREIIPASTKNTVLGSHLDTAEWDNLVGYWKFEGNASDSSGLGNDGVTRNGVKDTKGRVSDAYDFSSNGAVVQVSDDNSINPAEEITISFWLKNVSSFQNVLRKEQAYLVRSTSNSLSFGIWNNSGLKNFDDLSVSTKEGWNHYSFVFDGESYTGYRNGKEQDRINLSRSTIYDSDDDLGIGARGNDQGWGSIDGKLDEPMIFNTSLSSEKIEEIYNKTGGYRTDTRRDIKGSVQDVGKGDVAFDWRRNGDSLAVLNMPFYEEISTNQTGKVRDISTYENNGTLGDGVESQQPEWTNCPLNGCYEFDGSSTYISTTGDSSVRTTNNFSTFAWIKRNSSGSAEVGFAKYDYGVGKRSWNHKFVNGNYRAWVSANGADQRKTYEYGPVSNNSWVHVGFTFSTNNLTMYVNGEEVNPTSIIRDDTVNDVYDSGDVPVTIGAYLENGNPRRVFDGLIGGAQIYQRVLTPEQIEALYEEGEDIQNGINDESTLVSEETLIHENISAKAISGFKGVTSNATVTYNATVENYGVPSAETFDGSTNDFKQTNDLENVDVVLENTSHGMVNWSSSLNVKDKDFDTAVNISNNSISVNTSLLGNAFDSKANITFYNLSWNDPIVLKDGEVCSSCTETTYSNGDLTVQVSGFSTYTTMNGAPDCTGWWSNQTQPYEVGDVDDLQCVKEDIDANYTLTSDIDARQTKHWNDGDGFEPIGDSSTRFSGEFDGDFNEISHLYINRTSSAPTGLFGGNDGNITKLHLFNHTILGSQNTGAIVGDNIGTISRVTAQTGYVNGDNYHVAQIAGTHDGGIIEKVYANGVTILRSGAEIGQIAGFIHSSAIINNTYAFGTVKGTASNQNPNDAGGILGSFTAGIVDNSYSTAFINSSSSTAGGLIGSSGGTEKNSFWDINSSGQTSSAGGTGKTNAEMKRINTYTNISNSGLDNIWNISSLENHSNETWFIDEGWGYPRLAFEKQGNTTRVRINTSAGNSSKTFNLPLVKQGKYDFDVSWGDGDRDRITSWNDNEANHAYDEPGTYSISILGDIEGWSFGNTSKDNAQKITEISRWGSLNLGDTKNQFENTVNLDIKANDTPALNKTKSLSGAFKNSSIGGENIGNWDVSGVENFSDFLTDTNISLSTYSSLWKTWKDLNLENDVEFGGGSNRYNLTSMKYRQKIIDEFNWNIYDGGPTLDPLAKGFDGKTTNFSNVNLSNTSVTLEKTGHGLINWTNTLNATSRHYSKNVRISQDIIKVNVSDLGSEYDSEAEIRFYNLDLDDPVLLQDGSECESCEIQSYTGGTLKADVPGFGTYTTKEKEDDSEPYYGYGSILDDEKDNISNTSDRTLNQIGLGEQSKIPFNETYRINETGQNVRIEKENDTLSLYLDDERYELEKGQNNITVKDKRYKITLRNEGEDTADIMVEEEKDSQKPTDTTEQKADQNTEDAESNTSTYIWSSALVLLLLTILYATIKQGDSE